MAEWIVEYGIGETRAALIESERIVAARVYLPGEAVAGARIAATLTHKAKGASRGTATDEAGREVLVSQLPREASPGQAIVIEITRPAFGERDRVKRAHGRLTTDAPAPATIPGTPGRFPTGAWEDVWQEAWDGRIDFGAGSSGGGSLVVDVTRAMTLIDVDGGGPPRDLALAAVPALARMLRLFDMGGSIGVDFPTLTAKADRKSVDAALEEALSDWPHERTAMNGFGFVQIVARAERPSLFHRMAGNRVGMAARFLLRQAERAEGAGRNLVLTCHPAIAPKLREPLVEELARRTGKQVRIERDPRIAIGGGHAQIVGDG